MSDYQEDFDDFELPLFSAANSSCVIDGVNSVSLGKHCGEILSILRNGRPLSCFEVESRWHRGQAAIYNLRQDGHVIDTIRGEYRYRGFSGEMKTVSKHIQQKYYETSHWRSTARQRKEIDSFRCIQCSSENNLETHHWVYNLFEEDMSELSTLCRPCHLFIHEVIKCLR